MTTGIVGILNNPATSLNSHSAGWNEVVRRLVDPASVVLTERDDWSQYDRLIINHGVNFKPGSYNVIGGITDKVVLRSKMLSEFQGEVFQVDGFNFNEFIQKRSVQGVGRVSVLPLKITTRRPYSLIGDSHSISVWPNECWNISRRDGKTLFGFLKDPEKADWFYFGNIDVRFHLARQPDPHRATLELVRRYIDWSLKCKAKVTCLLPIESESRRLPGTGLYKGEPFYGSQKLRAELVSVFNTELLTSDLEAHQWPLEWYQDREFYEREVMEPGKSVHIKPKYYAFRQ
jgi:hypothetical protein